MQDAQQLQVKASDALLSILGEVKLNLQTHTVRLQTELFQQ
jgi:hypothetical protein